MACLFFICFCELDYTLSSMLRIIFFLMLTKKTDRAPAFSGGSPVFFAHRTPYEPGLFPVVRRQPVRFLSRKKLAMHLSSGPPAGLFCRKYLAKFTGGITEPWKAEVLKNVLL